jgi:hypothetical protein
LCKRREILHFAGGFLALWVGLVKGL